MCLLAAFADGGKDEAERARLRDVFESLGADDAEMPGIYQRVLLKQVDVAGVAAGLSSAEARSLAYELAVCVCEADDALNESERGFLERLRSALGTSRDVATRAHEAGDEILSLEDVGAGGGATGGATAGRVASGGGGGSGGAMVAPAAGGATSASGSGGGGGGGGGGVAVDGVILQSAIAAAALELLPQGLATAAVIPVQMNMVYRVGRAHGFALDRGHVKDLLAAVGVGVASQVVEGYARRALGGLLGTALRSVGGSAMGGVGRTLGSIAGGAVKHGTGPLMTFCTTYALGRVATQYYAGGRRFSAIDLKALFTQERTRAEGLYERNRPLIERRASGLDASSVRSMLAGVV